LTYLSLSISFSISNGVVFSGSVDLFIWQMRTLCLSDSPNVAESQYVDNQFTICSGGVDDVLIGRMSEYPVYEVLIGVSSNWIDFSFLFDKLNELYLEG